MIPRPVLAFVGVFVLGALIPTWALPVIPVNSGYWMAVLALAVIAAYFARSPGGARRGGGGDAWIKSDEFLCDSCKYDHPSLCSRPDRPNATRCPDYKRRG